MTERDDQTARPREAARLKRLREALRDNLKRRKSQARGRSDNPAGPDGKAGEIGISGDAGWPPCEDRPRDNREDAMAQLVVMYKTPVDAAAFDAHYVEKHIPLAKTLPGLRSYQVNTGVVANPAGPSGIHLVATLTFDNMAAIQAAFASPEGRAAAADVATFASGGADMFMFETKEV